MSAHADLSWFFLIAAASVFILAMTAGGGGTATAPGTGNTGGKSGNYGGREEGSGGISPQGDLKILLVVMHIQQLTTKQFLAQQNAVFVVQQNTTVCAEPWDRYPASLGVPDRSQAQRCHSGQPFRVCCLLQGQSGLNSIRLQRERTTLLAAAYVLVKR